MSGATVWRWVFCWRRNRSLIKSTSSWTLIKDRMGNRLAVCITVWSICYDITPFVTIYVVPLAICICHFGQLFWNWMYCIYANLIVAHAPTACTTFMYISTICLTMNSKLYDNHVHPHTLEYTCMHLPVGYPNQVSADHVNLMQLSSSWPSSLPLWSAPEKLLLGAMVRHPLHMA